MNDLHHKEPGLAALLKLVFKNFDFSFWEISAIFSNILEHGAIAERLLFLDVQSCLCLFTISY